MTSLPMANRAETPQQRADRTARTARIMRAAADDAHGEAIRALERARLAESVDTDPGPSASARRFERNEAVEAYQAAHDRWQQAERLAGIAEHEAESSAQAAGGK